MKQHTDCLDPYIDQRALDSKCVPWILCRVYRSLGEADKASYISTHGGCSLKCFWKVMLLSQWVLAQESGLD